MAGDKRLVYGSNAVLELVRQRAKTVTVVYALGPKAESGAEARAELRNLCRQKGVPIEERTRRELDELVGHESRHQGVCAVCGEYAYADLDRVLDQASARQDVPLVVVLDGVQDPHNLGAICRSALSFGAHALVIGRDRAAPVTPAAVKASAGATEKLAICQVTNVTRTLEALKKRQLWIVGTLAEEIRHDGQAAVVASGAKLPGEIDFTLPTVLVLGSEGTGMRHLVKKTCDWLVQIPTPGSAISLNVSVAAGILLYEARRQRG